MSRPLFVSLCGLVFLHNFGRVVFAPLVEPMRAAFGVGPAAIGGVVSLVWLGTALPRVPVGVLLTRVPRERIVLASGGVLAVAAAVVALAPTGSLLVLQAGGLLLGGAAGAYFVSAIPLIGDLYPAATGRAVGVHGVAAQVAAVGAPALALAAVALSSWRAAFGLVSAGAVAVTLLLWLVLRRTALPAAAGAGTRFRDVLGEWRVISTGVGMIAVAGFAWQGLFTFLVTYLVSAKGLTPATANALLTAAFAAGVPAFWLGGRLADRLPDGPYVAALLASMAAAVAGLTAVSGVAALAALSLAVGYAGHSLFPALDTYMLGSLPGTTRAGAYAVFSGISLGLASTGSAVVGTLAGRVGFDPVFRGLAVALGGVALVVLGLWVAGRLPPAGRRHR